MSSSLTIALAGNPNSGKSTIFNALTGSRQHVGNYPGVTVEKKEGAYKFNGTDVRVIDLPGTYSLTASSPEETVARNVLVDEKPALVVNIVDASNLERNLYLSVQLLEQRVPMIIVLNMIDTAKSKGIDIDSDKLAQQFGVPVIKTVGHRSKGIDELKSMVLKFAGFRANKPFDWVEHTESHLSNCIKDICGFISEVDFDRKGIPDTWYALKYLEGDKDIVDMVVKFAGAVTDKINAVIKAVEEHEEESAEILVAEHRYGVIGGICRAAVSTTLEARRSMSDKIDAVVTNRFFGIPMFLVLMYGVFWLTFTVGEPFMGLLESGFGWLGNIVSGFWPEGSDSLLRSLLVNGIIDGVGGVLVFLPNIILLFLGIAILEGTGYMARAAFIMDRFMNRLGLHGKSFIPMLIGFGCTVPAIMATRTLESHRDRMTTMLVAPLMSCGARLPIYSLLIPAFFPTQIQTPIMWSIYVIGIGLAIVCAKLLRSTLFKGEEVPFVMELPPYRLPTFRSIVIHMWERAGIYIKKAGTVILAISVLLWFASAYPKTENYSQDYSGMIKTVEQSAGSTQDKEKEIANLVNRQTAEELSNTFTGKVGRIMEPVISPLGFDWKIGTAMIGAFAAKEVFVAQMGIVFSVGAADENSETLRTLLKNTYTPLQGFCMMLFCLISTPCVATIAVTRRESNSWGWAFFQLAGLTVLAWIVTFVVYQGGTILKIGIGA